MAIKPEMEQAFLAMARGFVEPVKNEPGTLLYVLNKHPTREHTYVWVERYKDAEAGQQHRESSYMAEVRPRLATYLDGPPEAMRLEQVVPG